MIIIIIRFGLGQQASDACGASQLLPVRACMRAQKGAVMAWDVRIISEVALDAAATATSRVL